MEALPRVDDHAVDVRASPERVWSALEWVLRASFGGPVAASLARALGCRETTVRGPRVALAGSTLPGFEVAAARPPAHLALEGGHRFARYRLTFDVEEIGTGGSRLRALTEAAFPGASGRVYRGLVIGSRAHLLLIRRLLRAVARRAEHPGARTGGITG
ncbi:MAG: hypothetical protein ACJ76S_10595 [Solirubrobacteraceae bacterium]|jgi:hypothetical protein